MDAKYNQITLKVKDIINQFYVAGLSEKQIIISQVSYLFYIKYIYENNEDYMIFDVKSWDELLYMDAYELYDYFDNSLFTQLNLAIPFFQWNVPFSKYLEGATFKIPKPHLLKDILEFINQIFEANKKMKKERFFLGNVYTLFIDIVYSEAYMGQYLTPKFLTELIVEMVKPEWGELICDPFCGTGTFLTQVYTYMKNKEYRPFDKDLTSVIMGYEISFPSAEISKLKMLLYGVEGSNILVEDAFNFSEENLYDLVISHPPVGGLWNRKKNNSSKKLELMSLNKIMTMLKSNGRGAVIIPDSVLFGSSNYHKKLRQSLVHNFRIEGIVSIPTGVFENNVAIKTSLLLFTKVGSLKKASTKRVWFYQISSKSPKVFGRKVLESWTSKDKDYLLWKKKKLKSNCIWFADLEEIKKNSYDLSADAYKPVGIKMERSDHSTVYDHSHSVRGAFRISKPRGLRWPVTNLSKYQKYFYQEFVKSDRPLAAHEAAKKMRKTHNISKEDFGVQDAKQTVDMLEGLGLLEPLNHQLTYPENSEGQTLMIELSEDFTSLKLDVWSAVKGVEKNEP